MYYAYFLMEARAAQLNAARRSAVATQTPDAVPARPAAQPTVRPTTQRDWSRLWTALEAMAYAHPFWHWRYPRRTR